MHLMTGGGRSNMSEMKAECEHVTMRALTMTTCAPYVRGPAFVIPQFTRN